MRLNGRRIEGINTEYIVIPRSDGDIVLKAQAVLNYDEFDKLCPEPKPPMVTKPGGQQVPDVTNRNYVIEVEQYGEKRYGYFIIKSLSATEGLEFDTISLADPGTWHRWREEFTNAGLTNGEINLIVNTIGEANGINPTRVKEARERFLTELARQKERSSSTAAPTNMPSGEPANV